MMKKLLPLFIIIFLTFNLTAQKKNAHYMVHIHKTTSPVIIDGVTNDKHGNMQKQQIIFLWCCRWIPALRNVKTEVKVAYDDRNFYLLAVCYKHLTGKHG